MQRRLLAWLLLTVFLGAGTTLPGPDALLHHWGAQAERPRTHVEPAGGCGAHADRCTLGRTAAGAGAAVVQSPVVRADLSGAPALLITHAVGVIVADLDAIPHSRAPPASAV
jgi:hypothetical protein